MNFKFVVIPAPDGSYIQGPAVFDAEGNRIGQLVAEVVVPFYGCHPRSPLEHYAEDRRK